MRRAGGCIIQYMKKRLLSLIISFILIAGLAVPVFASAENGFSYKHDPMLNPSARADIVEDPEAIYGYRPSETGSLKMYASADWSDEKIVADGREERLEYHRSLQGMYAILDSMTAEGKSIEEIARAVSARRNELRLEAYADDPEGLTAVKARNLEKYGHEEGPLADDLYTQYGSWQTVIAKAFSTNSGMDACLGLYDDCYELYIASGQILPDYMQPVPAGYAVSKLIKAAGLSEDKAESFLKTDAEGNISRADIMCMISEMLTELPKKREALLFTDMPASIKDSVDRLSAAGLIEGTEKNILSPYTDLTVDQLGILCSRIESAVN